MPLNSYYSNTIAAFVKEDPEQVRLRLVVQGGNEPKQKGALKKYENDRSSSSSNL